ncbi:hypothetical protein T265_08252 [Opisthorchis viverrini]|uniref:Uncharacterized protein n=1 Tax=Opisthorchis viverrini TaxID=6198 RepID=A0A074ZA53_OPIVI|nr:hypothetical protein T265_08252 [Opisthorchis viverrini]KER24008.1 hypothetical protein T265_08252 [Opisthorchis viverrini]
MWHTPIFSEQLLVCVRLEVKVPKNGPFHANCESETTTHKVDENSSTAHDRLRPSTLGSSASLHWSCFVKPCLVSSANAPAFRTCRTNGDLGGNRMCCTRPPDVSVATIFEISRYMCIFVMYYS